MRFIIFSTVLATLSTSLSLSNIYWTNVTESVAFRVKSEPSGLLEGATEIYACKMWADNRWITGSFFFIDDYNVSNCTVVTYRKVYRTNVFQVLLFPPSSVSWIPSTGKYPDKSIIGGCFRHNLVAYVCRAKLGKSLLVGMACDNGSSCYMPQGEKEHHVGGASRIEILAENSYGTSFDEIYPRS